MPIPFCLCLTTLVFTVLSSVGAQTALTPKLFLETPEKPFRDMTVAADQSIFTYDYENYRIKKFDAMGRMLLEFGGTGTAEGQFTHLTGLSAVGDRLLAIDSTGLSTFDLQGRFLSRTTFTEQITPNFSIAFPDGRYIGFQIVASELMAVLTLRSNLGRELDRLAAYSLKEFFPELKAGEDFFLADEYTRNYLYAINSDGDLFWAATDALRVFLYSQGKSKIILEEALTPVPFPENEKNKLVKRKARIKPPLYLYVPTLCPLLHHLAVDAGNDLWIYMQSQEKNGFRQYSQKGKSKGFFTVSADFDVLRAVVRIFGYRMFFLDGKAIYAVDLPR